MEMKRMNLASFAAVPAAEMCGCEEAAGGHTSTSSPQGSVEIVPIVNEEGSLGSEGTAALHLPNSKAFLDNTAEGTNYGTLPPVMDLRSRLTGTWNPKLTNPGMSMDFEKAVLHGSELCNKKPYDYVEPRRLSIAKQKIKKQRAKMAKASKRANRSK